MIGLEIAHKLFLGSPAQPPQSRSWPAKVTNPNGTNQCRDLYCRAFLHDVNMRRTHPHTRTVMFRNARVDLAG